MTRQQTRAQVRADAFRRVNAAYGLEPRKARRGIARAWATQAWRKRAALATASCGILALFSFGATPSAHAQGSRKDDIVFNAQGRPMAGATVRVCTSAATGQPCAPLAPVYSDAALTQALANPLATDGLGNYTFYAAPGRYMIELSGPGITTKQISNVILPSDPSSPTFTSVTTTSGISAFSLSLSGNLTVSGSAGVTGALTAGGITSAGPNALSGGGSLNGTYTGNPTLSGNLTQTGNNNHSGTETFTGGIAASFLGPNPWRDVTVGANALVADGVTDNTANFNVIVTSACANNVHILYFPISMNGQYWFNSAPATIPCPIILLGNYSQWNGTGVGTVMLVANYNEAVPTNGFITFTGASAIGNSGIMGLTIWKGAGKTGGAAIKYTGTTTTARAGGGPIQDVRVSGSGTWNYGLYADGSAITTSGSQGLRDIAIRNLAVFQTTTDCAHFINVVHLTWTDGGCYPTGGGVASVYVGGAGSGTSASTNVEFMGIDILDTLTLDFVADFTAGATYVNNLTATANVVQSTFHGISNNAPSISGQLAYITWDGTSPAGYGTALTNSLRATNFLAAGAAIPSNITTGDVVASSSATGGSLKFGSDGNMACRRNNGSGAGSNLACSFDAFATSPFQWDNVNGFTTTKNIKTPNLLIATAAPTISSGFGTSPSIATSNGAASFTVNVGTGGTASSGVIGLPTATNGWNCTAFDATNPATGGGYYVKQTAGTTTTATLTGYNTAGAPTAWTASDILSVSCFAR